MVFERMYVITLGEGWLNAAVTAGETCLGTLRIGGCSLSLGYTHTLNLGCGTTIILIISVVMKMVAI